MMHHLNLTDTSYCKRMSTSVEVQLPCDVNQWAIIMLGPRLTPSTPKAGFLARHIINTCISIDIFVWVNENLFG
jgi:hypothetical protein